MTIKAEDREQTVTDLRLDVWRGQEAERGMRSDFWTKIVMPEIDKEREQADARCRWSPATGAKTVDEAGMRLSYFSGAGDSFRHLAKVLEFVIERGRMAAEELKRMESRK